MERDRKDLDSAKRSNMMLEQTLAQGLATLAHMAQNWEVLKGPCLFPSLSCPVSLSGPLPLFCPACLFCPASLFCPPSLLCFPPP